MKDFVCLQEFSKERTWNSSIKNVTKSFYTKDFISQVQQGCVYMYVKSKAAPQHSLVAAVIFPPFSPLNDEEILVFELNIHAGYWNFKCQKLGLSTFFQSTALHILGIKVRVVSVLGRCRNVFIGKRKIAYNFRDKTP